MSRKKKQKIAKVDTTDELRIRAYRKEALNLLSVLSSKASNKIQNYSRQIDYDDVFEEYYADTEKGRSGRVLQPPYNPTKMKELMEECAPLPACRDAYSRNVAGYGFEVVPIEGVEGEESPEVKAERKTLQELIIDPNGEYSFGQMTKRLEEDYRTTGNSYMEVVRSVDGLPSLLYWADSERMRIAPIATNVTGSGSDPVDMEVTVVRGGVETTFTRKKQFRKYAMVSTFANTGEVKLRWFKEWGDKRPMNALTGEYATDDALIRNQERLDQGFPTEYEPANELIHRKYGTGVYGIPPWIATLLDAMGVSRASYVNFDLFENQGIPPLFLLISGGKLSADSWEDLLETLRKAKGTENFNRMTVLEIESDSDTLTPTGGNRDLIPKVDMKGTGDMRKEDAMFSNYTEKGNESIRAYGFRLPGLYVGKTSSEFNRATAEVARELTEEQVFVPERKEFDELFNMTITKALGLKNVLLKSKGPKIVNSDLIDKLITTLAEKGGLTINELIEVVNENFGTNFEPYEVAAGQEETHWANQPIAFLTNPEIAKLWLQATIAAAGGKTNEQESQEKQQADEAKAKALEKQPQLPVLPKVSKEDDSDKLYEVLVGIEKIGKGLIGEGCA